MWIKVSKYNLESLLTSSKCKKYKIVYVPRDKNRNEAVAIYAYID